MSVREVVGSRPGESSPALAPADFRPVRFRADIQGLRAVAVSAVVLYHANLPGLSGGYVGVDVFFVISGFLITAHLLGSLALHGRIDLGEFYARRIRRILPVSFVVLVLSVAASIAFIPPLIRAPVLTDALATVLYVPNFQFANRNVDYLADPNPSVFQHYWSLGVEEQFYLFWPALLAVAFLVFRRSRRGIVATLVATLVCSLALSLWLTDRAQPWAFFMMPTRAWEFALGGLVAFAVTSARPRIPPIPAAAIGWAGLIGVVLCAFLYDEATVFPGTAAIVPVVATAAVILAGSGVPSRWAVGRLLGVRAVVFVGTLSYSVYLVHWPLLTIPQIALGDRRDLSLAMTLALAVASVPLAWILYRTVEDPARSWSALTKYRPRRTLIATLVVTALVATALVASVKATEALPLETARSAVAAGSDPAADATEFVPDNLRPGLRAASSDNPAIYANGCHLSESDVDDAGCTVGSPSAPLTVTLFGDSHAAQWYPALAKLAEEGKILLTTHTKSSCPSAAVPARFRATPYPECDRWRAGVTERLVASPTDVTILANFAESVSDPTEARFAPMWRDSVEETVRILSPVSRVIVLADTPHFDAAPSVCLSANATAAHRCAGTPEESFWPSVDDAEKTAAASGGGTYLSLRAHLCDDSRCPVILGDTLVYRDSHHLTATFSASLSSALMEHLGKAAGT